MGNWVFSHKCSISDLRKYKKANLVPIGKPFNHVKAKVKKNQLVVSGPMITDGYTEKSLNNKNLFLKREHLFHR